MNLIALVVAIASCALAQKVEVGYDKSVNFEKYKTVFTEYSRDGKKGGNVEFEWKVEEGES